MRQFAHRSRWTHADGDTVHFVRVHFRWCFDVISVHRLPALYCWRQRRQWWDDGVLCDVDSICISAHKHTLVRRHALRIAFVDRIWLWCMNLDARRFNQIDFWLLYNLGWWVTRILNILTGAWAATGSIADCRREKILILIHLLFAETDIVTERTTIGARYIRCHRLFAFAALCPFHPTCTRWKWIERKIWTKNRRWVNCNHVNGCQLNVWQLIDEMQFENWIADKWSVHAKLYAIQLCRIISVPVGIMDIENITWSHPPTQIRSKIKLN